MGSESDRLRAARERHFPTAKDAAEAMGVPVATYIQHENGTRGFNKHAERYAKRFKVTPEWLMFGTGDGDSPLPSEEELSTMLEGVQRELPASLSFGEWPQAAASALRARLELFESDRATRSSETPVQTKDRDGAPRPERPTRLRAGA